VWLLENVLTHPAATLTTVDTFGGPEHAGWNLAGQEARFRANTAPFGAKLTGHKGRGGDVLPGLLRGRYDFVCLAGSRESADVLAGAVLCWPLLKPGGLLCFDDYEWWTDPVPHRSPKLAVDSFLAVMRGRCEVVHKGYQVWVRKREG